LLFKSLSVRLPAGQARQVRVSVSCRARAQSIPLRSLLDGRLAETRSRARRSINDSRTFGWCFALTLRRARSVRVGDFPGYGVPAGLRAESSATVTVTTGDVVPTGFETWIGAARGAPELVVPALGSRPDVVTWTIGPEVGDGAVPG